MGTQPFTFPLPVQDFDLDLLPQDASTVCS